MPPPDTSPSARRFSSTVTFRQGPHSAEALEVPSGGLQVSKNESPKSGGDKDGEMCRWDGFITMHVDLIPNSQLVACHVIGGA